MKNVISFLKLISFSVSQDVSIQVVEEIDEGTQTEDLNQQMPVYLTQEMSIR